MIDTMQKLGGSTPKMGSLTLMPSRVASEPMLEPDSAKDAKQSVESLSGFFQNQRYALEFSVDEETGQVVIRVMDAEHTDVIRQYWH